MNEICLRHAVVDDIEALYRLFSSVDQMHRDAHPEIFKQAEYPEDIKKYYRTCILDPDVTIIIAERKKQIIGGLICSLETSPSIPILVPRKIACIENITVSQAFRNKGIGRLLIEAIQEWAVQGGASAIELTVWEFNQAAARFYERLGFQPFRRRMVKNLND